MWRDMARIRRFEERCGQVYAMGQIGGFCHLYIGQEAVVVGCKRWRKQATKSLPAIVIMRICWPAAWNRGASWPS